MDILTVRLNNGREVLAKLYKGEPCAATYSNRLQADVRQIALGDQWEVTRCGGRPFYVARKRAFEISTGDTARVAPPST